MVDKKLALAMAMGLPISSEFKIRMSRITEKDYATVVRLTNIDERNQLIAKLYNEGKEYFFTDKKKDGTYVVAYDRRR